MEKTSTIQKIKYVKGWQGNEQTLYFHEVTFMNGDHGKLERNSEEAPPWLVVDTSITYSIRTSSRGPLIMYLGPAGSESSSKASSSASPSESRKNHRYNADPAFGLRQQKCISMTTCLDRANELVIGDKIKLKEKHKEALRDFDFIMKHSGITALEGNSPDKSKKESSESSEEELGGPPSDLFDKPKAVPEFIKEALKRCKKAAHVNSLKSQLSPEEKDNPSIMDAISKKLSGIKGKKNV